MATAKKKQVLKYSKIDEKVVADLPGFATTGSAGIDIPSGVNQNIRPYKTEMVRTGIKVAIPAGHVGILCSRSSVGIKKGLTVAQGVGIIDSDYRGELMIPLYNRTQVSERVTSGERIAQLLIVSVVQPEIIEVETLDETERGENGFGSTGK